MPELQVNLSPHSTKDPELVAVQEDIIFARQEYADWENHNNPHEYLGVIEDFRHVIGELQRKHDEQLKLYPEATFILEYHQSCMLPRDANYLVVSFALQTRRFISGQESRLNTFICWRLDIKDDYSQENADVESFMLKNNIQPYTDGFGGSSVIQYEVF